MHTLKFKFLDTGNSRAYYTITVESKKLLFCLQENIRGTFQLYVCSKDGEPSVPVASSYKYELATGDHYFVQSVNNYIKSLGD